MSQRQPAASEAEQQIVFDLIHERLVGMFGANGSFTVSLGRPTATDAFFVSTVADIIARDVAAQFNPARESEGRRVARSAPEPESAIAEHDRMWGHLEENLGITTTGPRTIDADVAYESESDVIVHRTLLHHAA